ncbi:MAG: SGNH/GDSL hydrolase family protein [Planctomycetota bacterium]|jgi:hypothetical protein
MKPDAKARYVKSVVTAVIIAANLLLLVVPCDLAYNVAQHRDILLGRYTVDRLSTVLVLIFISGLIVRGIWTKQKKQTPQEKRQSRFKTVALCVSITFSIVLADVFLRLVLRKDYVGNAASYHRTPNTVQSGVNRDVSVAAFSYPSRPAGYPDLEYTLTVDKRGFRNKTDLEKYDVVTLGDSFTEGSHVSDDQAWPVLLAQKSDQTVYNLGMSGGTFLTYLDTLKLFGLGLSPQTVICMLYEGNDFRSSNFSAKKMDRGVSLESIYKSSPLRGALKTSLIRLFGPVGSSRFAKMTGGDFTPSHPLFAVSWLPLAVPNGPDAKYYAFKIKRLLSHFQTRESFLDSVGCKGAFDALGKIKDICDENNIRFVIAYCPDKPHVLLPLVKDRLSPQKLRAFMALKEDDLPSVEELTDVLMPRLEFKESAVEEFCRAQSIEFVSLTEPLRQEILKGRQVYYTYDQHWTPTGHEIAAETLCDYLQRNRQERP